MKYPVFLIYIIIRGVLRVTGFELFGYIIASLPMFREHQEWFLWAILVHQHWDFPPHDVQFRKAMKECVRTPEEMLDEMAQGIDLKWESKRGRRFI